MSSTATHQKAPSAATDSKKAPLLCQWWNNASDSLPSLRLFGLEFNMTAATFMLLFTLRTVYLNILVHIFHWPIDNVTTLLATASCTSITHSLLLVPALYTCLRDKQPFSPSSRMNEAPDYWQQTVTALLQFCTGYMIYDGLCSVIYTKWMDWDSSDVQFFLHHIATTVYMTATRYYQAGHESTMMCMFLGELTNPFHNGYYVADFAMKLDCCNGHKMQLFYNIVQFLFATSYVFVRAVVAPPVLGYTCYDLLKNGRSNGGIHSGMVILWVLLIVGVMAGSMPWVFDCWKIAAAYLPITEATPESIAKEL